MRFGIRSKDAVAVTLLTFLVVATTTMVHISQLTRVVIQEASGQAQLVAKQIYAQIGQVLTRAPGRPPLEALRRDRELRNLLESSVGYSPHLVYAFVSDGGGAALLDTRRDREGAPALEPGRLDELLDQTALRTLSTHLISRAPRIEGVLNDRLPVAASLCLDGDEIVRGTAIA